MMRFPPFDLFLTFLWPFTNPVLKCHCRKNSPSLYNENLPEINEENRRNAFHEGISGPVLVSLHFRISVA
jgi:hypothetical protein